VTLLAEPPVAAPEPEAPAPPTRGPRSRWWHGWRVPFRLARRDIARRPGRTLLVVLLMALPVAVMTLADMRYRSVEVYGTDSFAYLDYDARVQLSGEYCDTFCSRAQVEAVLPTGSRIGWADTASVPIRTDALGPAFVTVVVIDSNASLTATTAPRSGRWPTAANEVAMEVSTARSLELDIGSTFELAYQSRRFTLVGLLDKSGYDLMVAPGFDVSVVRPGNTSSVGFIDLPAGFDVAAWQATSPTGVQLSTRGYTEVYEETDLNRTLTLGWLAGVLGMSVLGVIVASAFAISGRRQLVMLGQLSASGADRTTVARSLGLLGTISGALGAVFGVIVALAVRAKWSHELFGNRAERFVIGDVLFVAVTAAAVATIAALAPVRSLTKVSVLSALGGRRPVGEVPAGVVKSGAVLFGGGLLVTVVAVRSGANGGGEESGILVVLGMIAAVLGVCALSPVMVDRVAGLVGSAGGALRIAARSLTRHRPRAAAVMASLLLVGMTASGASAFVEHNLDKSDGGPSLTEQRNDVVLLQSVQLSFTGSDPVPIDTPTPVPNAVRSQAADILGSIEWTSASLAFDRDEWSSEMGMVSYLVVDDAVLDLFGVSAAHRRAIEEAPRGVQLARNNNVRWPDSFVPVVDAPELQMYAWLPFVSSAAAESMGLTVVRDAYLLGRTDHSITLDEAGKIDTASAASTVDALYYDIVEAAVSTSWELSQWPDSGSVKISPQQWRVITAGITLLIVTLIVAFGMALWAVEGRDERDVLVAVGASPSTMAKVAGWRAGGLTLAAMVVAVPAGLAVAWMFARAATGHISMPWMVALLLTFAVPFVVGVGAWGSSAIAQRVRPVRMSSLTTD
jgi:putative ABC transport system permease protein